MYCFRNPLADGPSSREVACFGLSPDGKTLAIDDEGQLKIVALPVRGGGDSVTLVNREPEELDKVASPYGRPAAPSGS